MKKSLLFLLLVLNLLCYSQPTPWLWARQETGSGNYMDITSIATDAAGNSYVVGFYGYTTFTLGTYILACNGPVDAFFAKYDSNGNLLWVNNVTGSGSDSFTDVKIDHNGIIYLAGIFNSTLATVGSHTLTSNGFNSFFLLKADANGNIIWTKSSSKGIVGSCKMALSGNKIMMAGGFSSTQPFIIDTHTLTSSGSENTFIVNFDSGGNVLWAKNEGGTGDGILSALAIGPGGEFYLTGTCTSTTIAFDTFTLTGSAPLPNNGNAMFIAKHDSLGNVLWAKGISQPYNTISPNALKVDPFGNFFIAGYFSSNATFDTYSLTTTNSDEDAFIVKYTSGGNVIWAQNVGGGFSDSFTDLVTDAGGSAYLSGVYESTVVNLGNYTLLNDTNVGTVMRTRNSMVVVFGQGGQVLSAQSAGNKFGTDNATSIAIDNAGNIFIGGWYSGPNTVIGSYTLTNTGNKVARVLFVSKTGGPFVGIKETVLQNSEILIYPNPGNGKFQVRGAGTKIVDYLVMDLSGKIIANSTSFINNNDFSVDISGNPPGTYVIQIKTPEGILSKKLILQ